MIQNGIFSGIKTGLSSGLSHGIRMGAPPIIIRSKYCRETKSLIARMTVSPSNELAALIDKTIRDLKSAGVWDKDDCRYHVNLHTEQASCLNWVSENYNLIAVNAPVWTTKVGYQGAATKYLKNGYIPLTHGVNYTENNGGVGLVSLTNLNGAYCDMGTQTATVRSPVVYTRLAGYNQAYINILRENYSRIANLDSSGYFDWQKRIAGKIRFFKTGAFLSEQNCVDGILSNRELFFMADNDGAPVNVSLRAYNHWRVYGGNSDTNIANNYTIIKYFNDNVGGTF